MQDAIAIAVALAAGLWLARTLVRQLAAPGCGQADTPPGSDGFVPLDALGQTAKKGSGRPAGRPDR
ncbi:MAG: hypothetical protein ACKOCX_10770 [Planctomycetota bacterium]